MAEPRAKRRRTSYFLWFFLGSLGGHRFYLRHIRAGFALFGYTVTMTITDYIAFEFFPDVDFFTNQTFFWLTMIPLWIFLLTDAFKIPKWVDEFNQKETTSVFS